MVLQASGSEGITDAPAWGRQAPSRRAFPITASTARTTGLPQQRPSRSKTITFKKGARKKTTSWIMASNTWMAKLKYMQKLEGVHKWEKRWVAKGSMMVL
jgi:hypothetical protein